MHEELALEAETLTTVSEIAAHEWDACAGDNPFLKHAFLLALEQSGSASAATGWQPSHIRLLHAGTSRTAGLMPLYLKNHSYGEYVFDHAWANAYERAGGHYYPKLQSSVPFTPVTAEKLLVAADAPDETKTLLLRTAQSLAYQQQLSSLHLTFLPPEEAELAESEGYLIRTDQQFHWQNENYESFNHFLERLPSRKRKQIKKERRTALSSGINIEVLEGNDISGRHWDAFYEFYLDTGRKKWGQPYLNREFFEHIGQSMPENIVLMLCVHNGQYIAGALNFKNEETIYGRYWGCIEDHPCLHFETCYYQAIDYAIKHRLKTVEAGAQGTHKLARGYVPTLTYSAHWIENIGFRDAVSDFLKHERQNVDAEVQYLATKTPFKKI